jgi:UDP-N-acetylenolpyruvoylglucosamine reductase
VTLVAASAAREAVATSKALELLDQLEDLRARTVGTLHTPADPTWDQMRTPWVVNVQQTPLAVLEVASADDVVTAVRWAAAHGRQVSAQPSGHGATDRMDGVLLLRTRSLAEVAVDTDRRTAWVGAGVKAGELLAALEGTGLTFLAGSNPDPSVVGMTITGGISWFGRKYGVGADSIRAVELVDGAGRLRTVSASEDPELLWALRGGGGDFGIITRVELDLHPAPQVYGGRLLWPAAQTRDVLRAFVEVTRTAPRELSLWFHAYQFPPFPEVPEPLRGKTFASVAVAHLGPAEEAEELLAPFRALPGLVMDLMGEVPLPALGSIADEPTDPTPALEHSWLLDRVDEELVERVAAVLDAGTPLAALQIRHLGGAFTDVRPGQGSHGPVPEPYSLFALGIPAVPELVDPIMATFDRLGEAVARHTSGRTLLNFLGAHGDPSRWWSEATRDRLAVAKAGSDPSRVIRSNRPVAG